MENKPILIVGALKKEKDYLIEKIENNQEEMLCTYKIYKGVINNYPIVIAKTEIGLINASSCLTLAIEKYKPI